MKRQQLPILIAIATILAVGGWALFHGSRDSRETAHQTPDEAPREWDEKNRPASSGGPGPLQPIADRDHSGATILAETNGPAAAATATPAAGAPAIRLLSEDEWKQRGEATGLSLEPRRAFIRKQIPVQVNFRPLEAARDRRIARVPFDLGLGGFVFGDVKQVVKRSPNSYTLQGNLESDPHSEFSVSVQEDVAVGTFNSSDFGTRQLRYAGEGIHLVQVIDVHLAPPCGTDSNLQAAGLNEGAALLSPEEILADEPAGGNGTGEEPPAGSENLGDPPPAGTTLDVMVVYSTVSRVQQGGLNAMLALINQGVDNTNLAFQNSQVDAELRLVHTEEVSYTGSSGGPALTALRLPSDGSMDEIHALRDANGADFVSLWHEVTDVCGVGYIMRTLSTGFASLAFNVTDPDCQFQHTFSHELGHNFGLAHAVGDNGAARGGGLYNFSHGWRWNGTNSFQYRSIMAYSPGTRVRHYSNPSVNYQGTATGRVDLEDNARSLTLAKDTLAAFRNTAGDDHGNTITSATTVGTNTATAGILEVDTDLDVFRFSISSTDIVTVETTGAGVDTFGRLLNSTGGEIERDANDGSGSNFQISRTLSAGTYYVEVSSENFSIGAYSMRVTVGNDDHGNDIGSATPVGLSSATQGNLEEGGDEDFFRVILPTPGTLEVFSTGSTDTTGQLLNSVGGLIQSDTTGSNFGIIRFLNAGTYYIRVTGNSSFTTGYYSLVVSFTGVPDDHGNTFDDATTVTLGPFSDPESVPGEFEYTGDADVFRFVIPATDPADEFEMMEDPVTLVLNGFTEGNKTLLQEGGYSLQPVNGGDDFFYEDGVSIPSNLPANGSGYVRVFADDSLEIVEGTGGAFDILSMDLAEYSTFYDSPQSITFRGHKVGGLTTTFTFITDGVIDGTGPLADFQHVDFPESFRNLLRMEVVTPPVSIDNIEVQPSSGAVGTDVTLDIETPPAQPPNTGSTIAIYQEESFTVKPIGPIDTTPPFRLSRYGDGFPSLPNNGGNYLRLLVGDSLEVIEDSNRAFDAVSVDLAEFSSGHQTPKAIGFKGYKVDGSTVTHTFTTDGVIDGSGPLADFQTFTFPASFQAIVRLEAMTDQFGIDNIAVFLDADSTPNQGTLEIRSTGGTDTMATLYDSSFSLLESNDTGGSGANFLIRRDVSPGTYYVRVEETGGNSTGVYDVLFGYLDPGTGPPDAPAGVTATDNSSTTITVNWGLVAAAESYSIHRNTANDSAGSTTLASGVTGTSFVDETAAAEIVYYYWVKSTNFEGESAFSLHDTGYRVAAAPLITNQPPDTPVESGQSSVLSVAATTGSGTISYQWYEGVSGDTSAPAGSNSATLSVPNQTINTRYWVRVTNHIGSTDSQTANVAVLPNRPGRVIATENLFLDRIRITWESTPAAVSYKIYRGTNASFSSASLLSTEVTTHFEDTGAATGTRYWYFVQAVDADGDEGYFLDNTTRDGVRAAGPLNGTVIPIREVSDLVFDGQSAKLYISTDIGTVEQYDVVSRTVPKSYYAGSSLRGIDITPDDSTLLVADLVEDGNGGKGFIHRIVPATDAVTKLEYNLGLDEGGSFDVGIFSNSSAFVTTETTASAALPIRELNPASGVFSIRADAPGSGGGGTIGERSVIIRNTARTDGAILESNEATGPWFEWDPSGGSFGAARLSGSAPFRGAVNRNGTLVALSNYPGAKVFAPNGSLVRDLGGNAAGMCFSPLVDELYVADFQANRIRGFNTATWQEKFFLPIPGGIVWNPQLGEGTLEISPDGRTLALATDDEVRLFDLTARVTPPVAPVTVTASDDLNDRVSLSWSVSPAADSYNVYRNTVNDSGSAAVVASSLTGFAWDDTNAAPVTTYYYWIKAANVFGEGNFSVSESGVRSLVAPTGLTATNQLDGIRIDWNADFGVNEYWIYRNTTANGFSSIQIATVTAGATYTDTAIDPGRDYYYFVRAVANGIPSPYTAPTVGRRLYPAPAGVAATDASFDDKVRVNWGGVSGAVEYVIYRNATPSEAGAVEIGRQPAGTPSYDDVSATPGTPYFYAVRAVMPGGEESVLSDWEEGELSAEATFLPDEKIGKSPGAMLGNGVYNTSGAGQTIRVKSKRRKRLRFYFELENDGVAADTLKVAATRGNRLFRAVCFEIPAGGGRVNVTAAAVTGTYSTALGPGESRSLQLEVKRKGKKNGRLKRKVFNVMSASQNAPERKDAAIGKAESR